MTRIEVTVAAVRAIARDVMQVDLKARSGAAIAGAEPGAHIDLHLPHGPVRQYSLVNAIAGSAPMDHWRIAVGWDANSRGGSHWIHEKLRVGQVLQASSPRNQFALDPAHRRVLLVAGGIGMTPIYAMARHCAAMGLEWQLIACARSATRQVYADELKALAADRVETWCDDDRGAPIDLTARLAGQRWDGVYACGPAPMLNAIEQATSHWTPGSVRMERFKAETASGERKVFELVLAQSGLATQAVSYTHLRGTQPTDVGLVTHHGKVDLAGDQRLSNRPRTLDHQQQAHFREQAPELPDGHRQRGRCQCMQAGNSQLFGLWRAQGFEAGRDTAQRIKHTVDFSEQGAGLRRRRDPAVATRQQLNAAAPLQLRQCLRDGGLAHMQGLGGAAERPQVQDGAKHFQLAQCWCPRGVGVVVRGRVHKVTL